MDQETLKEIMSELGKLSWEVRKKKKGITEALSSAGKKGQKAMRKTLKKRAKLTRLSIGASRLTS